MIYSDNIDITIQYCEHIKILNAHIPYNRAYYQCIRRPIWYYKWIFIKNMN